MKKLCDVNLAFAILVEDHPHHRTAFRWWEQQSEGTVALTSLVQLGVLRLLTNDKVMGQTPLATERALEAWGAFCHDVRTYYLQPDYHLVDSYLLEFVRGRESAPNLWSDAWLAAAAESAGVGLSSFDSDFHQFKLSNFEHLKMTD